MPPFWIFKRVDRPEWMDTRSYPPEVVRKTLDFLGMTHRRFGGNRAVLRRFEEWSAGWTPGEIVTVLDVGTGGADVPLALARWARERGFRLKITAVDLMPEIAAIAREKAHGFPEIEVVPGDAFALGGTWDYVMASLLLHHVPPADNAAALRKLRSLARRGLVVSDLERSLPAYAAIGLLSWIAGNAVVRHDGPLSVRRAFTPGELQALALEAGLPRPIVRREPFFRLSLAAGNP